MSSAGNPLIPAGYDIAWSVVAIMVLALTILAITSLARSAKHLTAIAGLMWTLLVLFVPVLGPVAWLSIGRRTKISQHHT